jgi:hypothetical protein
MREILPGVHHWTARHPNIGTDVSCYYVEPAAVAIDPLLPAEGADWFDGRPLEGIVLTNRHHLRDAARLHERFGVPVLVNERGLHEVEGQPGIETFGFGDEVAPGVVAHGVMDGWPDEGVLHLALGDGVLAIADGLVRYGGRVGFVPDQYLAGPDEDAEDTKAELKAAYRRLAGELEFDAVLYAHGDPAPRGGRDEILAFVG